MADRTIVTVFGLYKSGDKTIEDALTCLYGPTELSEKDKKKMAKMEKFLAKQQKADVSFC